MEPYGDTTGVEGWTCFQCKKFVPNGCTHACGGSGCTPNYPDSTNTPARPAMWQLNVPADLRAAEALERCADALDRIAKTLEEG